MGDLPRFLSFIDLGYILDTAKVADTQFEQKIKSIVGEEGKSIIYNTEKTRNVLMRALFISAFAALEQCFDELVLLEKSKRGILVAPSDLKDRGITRSLNYAEKILGKEIILNSDHWRELFILQDVRNHLVHYGPSFSDSEDHAKKIRRFEKSKFLSLKPAICFSSSQLNEICSLFCDCINDFDL